MSDVEYEEVIILVRHPGTVDEATYVVECNIPVDMMQATTRRLKIEGVYCTSTRTVEEAQRWIRAKYPQQ